MISISPQSGRKPAPPLQLETVTSPERTIGGSHDVESRFAHFVFPQSDEYATREYQKNIVSKALFENTLVVLPTGLGKTFIAAVVMYNHLRWFPDGKIIFMAPTRPLVTQQIEACHQVVGIDEKETAEMNGQVSAAKRQRLWRDKRVFYCTPQTAEKDLQNHIMPKENVSLVVIDEAHRAVGRYAFVNVVQGIYNSNKKFRVLALSATPGKDTPKVQEVVTNLLISNIEYKSEADPDVRPYVFQKLIDVVDCPMNNECQALINDFNKIIDSPLKRLKGSGLCPTLPGSAKDLSNFQVVHLMTNLHVAVPDGASFGYLNVIRGDIALLATLTHVRTLMVAHGLSAALNHIRNHLEVDLKGHKKSLVNSLEWKNILVKMNKALENGGANPKIAKLKELLREHFERFKQAGKTTSVIVFAQYRDSVVEIVQELRAGTTLRLSPFVGQAKSKTPEQESEDEEEHAVQKKSSKAVNGTLSTFLGSKNNGALRKKKSAAAANVIANGQSQKEQQEVVRKFRAGEIDVLVATCIGEEGLDIGSVDLTVSYDALQSPVRMIQRFGRAGRKRAGRIIVLVADEKEKQMLSNGTKMSANVHRLLKEMMWKLKLFRPPPEAFMFPDSTAKPTIQYRKLDIGEFLEEHIGGHSGRKKRKARSADFEDDGSDAETTRNGLNQEEYQYLNDRFASRLLALDFEDEGAFSATVLNQSVPRLAYEDLLSSWKTPAQGYQVFSSGRSEVVKQTARFVHFKSWKSSQASQDTAEGRINSQDDDLQLPILSVRKPASGIAPQIVDHGSEHFDVYDAPAEHKNLENDLRGISHKADDGEVCDSQNDVPMPPPIGCQTENRTWKGEQTSDPAAVSQSDVPLPPQVSMLDSRSEMLILQQPHALDSRSGVSSSSVSIRLQRIDGEIPALESNALIPPDLEAFASQSDVPMPPALDSWSKENRFENHMDNNPPEAHETLIAKVAPAIVTQEPYVVIPGQDLSQTPQQFGRGKKKVRFSGDDSQTPVLFRANRRKDDDDEDATFYLRRKKSRLVVDAASTEKPTEVFSESTEGTDRAPRRLTRSVSIDDSPENEISEKGDDDDDDDDERRDEHERRQRRKAVGRALFETEAYVDDSASEDEDDGSHLDQDLESFIDDEGEHNPSPEALFRLEKTPVENLCLRPGRKANIHVMPVISKALERLKRRGNGEEEEDEDDFVVEWSNSDESQSQLTPSEASSSPGDILRRPTRDFKPQVMAPPKRLASLKRESMSTLSTLLGSERSSVARRDSSNAMPGTSSAKDVASVPVVARSREYYSVSRQTAPSTANFSSAPAIRAGPTTGCDSSATVLQSTPSKGSSVAVIGHRGLSGMDLDRAESAGTTMSEVASATRMNFSNCTVEANMMTKEGEKAIAEETKRRIAENRERALMRFKERQGLTQARPSEEAAQDKGMPRIMIQSTLPSEFATRAQTGSAVWSKVSEEQSVATRPAVLVDSAELGSLFGPWTITTTTVAIHSLEPTMTPLLFDAHAVISPKLCVRVVRDVQDLDQIINRLLQRYSQVALIFLGGVEGGILKCRQWESLVRPFVANSWKEVEAILQGLVQGEESTLHLSIVEMLLATKRAPVRFVANARGSNLALALALVSHFSGSTLRTLMEHTTMDLLTRRVARGILPAHAAKMTSAFKRVWNKDKV